VSVAFAPPKQIKKKSVLFLKPLKNVVKNETIEQQLVAVELSTGPLEQLSMMANEIFMPLLSHPDCREQWSETVQRDIMDKMHAFLANLYVMIGSTKGETLLPLPPADAYAGDPAANKDRVHLLEAAIVRWSRQITQVRFGRPPFVCHRVVASVI
jgi:dynein heavy chain